MWGVASGKVSKPARGANEIVKWEMKDEKVVSYIWFGVHNTVLHQLSDCDTINDAREKLKNMCETSNVGRVMHLTEKMQNMWM